MEFRCKGHHASAWQLIIVFPIWIKLWYIICPGLECSKNCFQFSFDICRKMYVGKLQPWLANSRTTPKPFASDYPKMQCQSQQTWGKKSLFHPSRNPPKTTDHWTDIYYTIIKYLQCLQKKLILFENMANVKWRKMLNI